MKRSFLFALMLILLAGCAESEKQQVTRDEHFNSLFQIDSGGVTGADGAISIALPDGRSVFLMGDSFLGEVVDNSRDPNSYMMRNSFILLNEEQNKTTALYQGTYDKPSSFLSPPDTTARDTWYWPGHGFARDSVLHLFMSEFYKGKKGQWGFRFYETDYLRLSYPGLEVLSNQNYPFTDVTNVHWGHAVVDENPYVYIYGSHVDRREGLMAEASAHVMRAEVMENGYLGNFRFFDGSNWVADPEKSRAMKGISASVSEQFSVFKYNDRYVLLTQQRGMREGAIYTYVSDQPVGPWGNETMVYETTEQKQDTTMITYNAMAHPQYIEDGKLLVSYNVNSLNPPDIMEDARKYRPRFLRVPMDMILE